MTSRINLNEEPSPAEWINQFLAGFYFSLCGSHEFRNNHKNNFCIDCETLACHHCMSDGTHDDHRVLRIYRLSHTNVVPRDDINRYLDCSGIQPYRCSERIVLALHPLPHYGTGRFKQQILCRFCSRKLNQPNEYQFCSIACKFEMNDEKPTATEPTVKRPEAGDGAGPSDKTPPRKRSRNNGSTLAGPSLIHFFTMLGIFCGWL